jgi:hypothetical protein
MKELFTRFLLRKRRVLLSNNHVNLFWMQGRRSGQRALLHFKGGRTPTASRHTSRHERIDAVLLHSWFRLESAHRSSKCLHLITYPLVDITYTGADVWVLRHRKERCRVLLHLSAAWSWRQHHDSDRCAAVFIISFVSTILLSCRHRVLTYAGVRPTLVIPQTKEKRSEFGHE